MGAREVYRALFVSTSSEVRRSSRSFSRSLRLNIVGSAEVVKELLTKFSISFNGTGGRITDRFPDARGEGFSDVNVEIVDEDAEELIEWCEAHKLECEVF
jgi:acyl-CoA synthetase (AMP-forming)/AMP-acid ligase II